MKICVIGAGPSGLITAKYSAEHGHDCEVFEQTNHLGGIWNYMEETDDSNETSFRSPIYKDLKVIIPKECMAFKGFPYSSDIKESYIGHALVLDYFHKFADHFNLHPLIKYSRRVLTVKPTVSNGWEVLIGHVGTKITETRVFDAVMVCNGHFSTPRYPTNEGRNVFEGIQKHSLNYRDPAHYKDKIVLVIGAGSSGLDIAQNISTTANHVFLSHRKATTLGIENSKLTEKPEVLQILKDQVELKDGERLMVDVIIYATGYLYNYPFLSAECKINVDDNWVQYLYKHIVNVEYPTMFFIGALTVPPIMQVNDIQARFALSVLENRAALPKKQQMLDEILERYASMKEKGISKKYFHRLGAGNAKDYFDSLSTLGKIDSIQPVMLKIFKHSAQTRKQHLYIYRIVDDDNFEISG